MSKTQFQFFALPDEERTWLASLISDPDIWCLVSRFVPQHEIVPIAASELSDLDFSGESHDALTFFLGHCVLADAPVWRNTSRGNKQIDFVQSRAIQLAASVVHDDILLDGQLAIMQPAYYVEAGIDAEPLQRWFKAVARSFRKLSAPDAVLIQRTTLGTINRQPDTLITPGAVRWRSQGRHLKQFVNGDVEFDIQLTTDTPG